MSINLYDILASSYNTSEAWENNKHPEILDKDDSFIEGYAQALHDVRVALRLQHPGYVDKRRNNLTIEVSCILRDLKCKAIVEEMNRLVQEYPGPDLRKLVKFK